MLIGDDSANEEPRLSSAASLLRLHHLDARFGPTYTHQCFDDERVRGFQPYDDAIRETERRYATSPLALMRDVSGAAGAAGAGASRLALVSRQASRGLRESLVRGHDLPHKSFQHHETATHRLSLEVVLAPSCRSCAVIIRTEAKKRERAGSTASEASLVSSSSSSVPSSRSVSPSFNLQVQPTNDNTAGGGAGRTSGGGKRRRVGRNDSDCENSDRKSPPLAVGAAASMSVLEQLDSIADGNSIGTNANNTATAISSTGPKIVFSSKSTTGIPLAAVAPGVNTMIVRPLSSYADASGTGGGGGRAGRTRHRRMEIDEVLDRISRALPPLVRCDHIRTDELRGGDDDGSGGSGTGLQLPLVQMGGATIDEVRRDYLSHPLGTVLKEYQRPIRNANAILMTSAKSKDESMGDFVLCLADGRDEGVAAYHNRVQRLALWYIENGSEVDLASTDSGGYWKVLYVFRRHAVADVGDDDSDDDVKMPSVAGEADDGRDGDDVKPPASSSGDQTWQTSFHQSSPLVKRAVKSFYSTCDSLVTLFSGRHSQGSDNSRRAFEERVNAEPLDLPLPSSQSLEGPIDDDSDDDEDSSSTVKYEYSLVGFMTLFHCYSQYKKPSAGTVCRMCQVVVLPSFQRAGHGKMMMIGAHEVAKGRYADMIPPSVGQRGDIVEVDVEDPAIEFTSLRDRVDYEMVRDAIASDPRSVLGVNVADVTVSQEDYYLPLSGQELVEASSILKITPDQVQIALELYKRTALDDEILRQMREKKKKPATKRQAVAKLEGMYESMVKKRLYKVYREDISGCGGGKAEKDAVLDYLYDETMAHYRSILGKRKVSRK